MGVIKTEAGNSSVICRTSGIIIPVKDKFARGRVSYDEIITACHSLSLKDLDPTLEFYFVRSESLDPATGLPTPANIVATPGIVNPIGAIQVQDLIAYLRHASMDPGGNDVRRIEKFRPINQELSDLNHQCPKYNGSSNDCGYGILNQSFNFPAVSLVPIHVMNHEEVDHMISHHAIFDYYALGYPSFSYHNLGGYNTPMHGVLRLSPLTLTKDNSGRLDTAGNRVLRILPDGLLHHGTIAAKGMSGGPVFMFDNGAIYIMGLVQSGDIINNQNNACIL